MRQRIAKFLQKIASLKCLEGQKSQAILQNKLIKAPHKGRKKHKIMTKKKEKKLGAPAASGDEAPKAAETQVQDSKHGITGAEISEYTASPTGYPKSQTVYQADDAEKGDFIVEYVENDEHVTFHPDSGGKLHPNNEQRVIPTVHTRMFSPKTRDNAKADAEEFAATKKGSKIFKK